MNRKPGWLRLLPEQHELLRIDHVRVFFDSITANCGLFGQLQTRHYQ
jgi:hypothetical protein